MAQSVAAGKWPGMTSVTISVEGTLLAQAFSAGVSSGTRHDVRSATKSVTAILFGELLEDGEVAGVDVAAAELVPRRFGHIGEEDPRRFVSVRDLLTMRTGFACDDWVPASLGHEDKMYESDDWVGFFVSQPMSHARSKHFSYCTGGVLLLGEIIEAVTGKSVPVFAGERLFLPLGIESAQWATTPEKGTDTGGHLRLTAGDFHKIGVLMAHRGRWQGNTVIQDDWWSEMTAFQTKVYERRSTYGYLWWRDEAVVDREGDRVAYLYAHGNGGNFVFVVPSREYVATFTGVNFGSPLQFQPIEIFREELIPSLCRQGCETMSSVRPSPLAPTNVEPMAHVARARALELPASATAQR